jgi:tetratricopeptide (TPR) repeat protein
MSLINEALRNLDEREDVDDGVDAVRHRSPLPRGQAGTMARWGRRTLWLCLIAGLGWSVLDTHNETVASLRGQVFSVVRSAGQLPLAEHASSTWNGVLGDARGWWAASTPSVSARVAQSVGGESQLPNSSAQQPQTVVSSRTSGEESAKQTLVLPSPPASAAVVLPGALVKRPPSAPAVVSTTVVAPTGGALTAELSAATRNTSSVSSSPLPAAPPAGSARAATNAVPTAVSQPAALAHRTVPSVTDRLPPASPQTNATAQWPDAGALRPSRPRESKPVDTPPPPVSMASAATVGEKSLTGTTPAAEAVVAGPRSSDAKAVPTGGQSSRAPPLFTSSDDQTAVPQAHQTNTVTSMNLTTAPVPVLSSDASQPSIHIDLAPLQAASKSAQTDPARSPLGTTGARLNPERSTLAIATRSPSTDQASLARTVGSSSLQNETSEDKLVMASAAPTPRPAALNKTQVSLNGPSAQGSSELSGATKQAELQRLLRKAQLALEENELTLPVGRSAYDYYHAALRYAPENATAAQGLSQLPAQYERLIWGQLSRGNVQRARFFFRRYVSFGWKPDANLEQEIDRLSASSQAPRRAVRDVPQVSETPQPNPTAYSTENKTLTIEELRVLAKKQGDMAAIKRIEYMAGGKPETLPRDQLHFLLELHVRAGHSARARALLEMSMNAGHVVHLPWAKYHHKFSGLDSAILYLEGQESLNDSASAYLAAAYHKTGNFARSLVLYEELLLTDQTNGLYLLGYALAADSSGADSIARDAYRRALSLGQPGASSVDFIRQRLTALQ